MATEVVMPQMGESIAEGTITKWLKNVGDHVERDEPLFEISTDKVDAEIPSPAAGTLTEIKIKEGETVEVNTVVAVLDGDGAKSAPAAPEASCRNRKHQRNHRNCRGDRSRDSGAGRTTCVRKPRHRRRRKSNDRSRRSRLPKRGAPPAPQRQRPKLSLCTDAMTRRTERQRLRLRQQAMTAARHR